MKYEKVGESLTRDVRVFEDGTLAEDTLAVGDGDTMAREVDTSSQDQILLTPDEKAILREWNLTSIASSAHSKVLGLG